MRIFLDVGAHTGESLAAALDPEFKFDLIVCFEPVRSCHPRLRAIADRRVRIEPFGLWNKTTDHAVWQPGTKGAGLWKKDNGRSNETEVCQFVRASEWFRTHVRSIDQVYLKLNCEGAECDILEDLLDAGLFENIAFTMIDFDVRKIAAMRYREAELRERLAGYPFPRVATSKQVMVGATHQDRIKHWLRACQ